MISILKALYYFYILYICGKFEVCVLDTTGKKAVCEMRGGSQPERGPRG